MARSVESSLSFDPGSAPFREKARHSVVALDPELQGSAKVTMITGHRLATGKIQSTPEYIGYPLVNHNFPRIMAWHWG